MNEEIKIIEAENVLPEKILGISSAKNAYAITWAINNALGITLKLAKSIKVGVKRDTMFFVVYTYIDSGSNFHLLISNKAVNGTLSSDYKAIDYFYYTNSNKTDLNENQKKIKDLKGITGSFIIDADKKLIKYLEKYLETIF